VRRRKSSSPVHDPRHESRLGRWRVAIDYLSYLDAWVERGQAPDAMIGGASDRPGPAYDFRSTGPGSPLLVRSILSNDGRSIRAPAIPRTPANFARSTVTCSERDPHSRGAFRTVVGRDVGEVDV